ncbi:methyltransferase family protein [Eisenbergiella sp.]
MNGFLLLIPFLLIRFTMLSHLNKDAVKRAAFFAPMAGNEMAAYWIYQLSNAAIFISLFFLKAAIDFSWQFWLGAAFYLLGLAVCAASIVDFSAPSEGGMNQNGVYRFSRNPMYLSYFLLFMGCAILTHSAVLGGIVIVFQLSSHWIILSEERWCIEKFGEAYRQYMKRVRRYI